MPISKEHKFMKNVRWQSAIM
uniref:Uncharacterized protein n=1 Tax=Arundo donax TaxID=35708 RepID=A0A0A9GRE9_ARUDO